MRSDGLHHAGVLLTFSSVITLSATTRWWRYGRIGLQLGGLQAENTSPFVTTLTSLPSRWKTQPSGSLHSVAVSSIWTPAKSVAS